MENPQNVSLPMPLLTDDESHTFKPNTHQIQGTDRGKSGKHETDNKLYENTTRLPLTIAED